jgi:hypothetical protein
MAGGSVNAHVQDDAVRSIGWRLLVGVAVTAPEVDVERALRIGLNLRQRAAQL